MTTFYPNQPAPSFLKKYARNAYNRAQHDAHHQQYDESAIDLQPYRSTPLILPGAKCNLQRNLPTDSYLRHHPNPQMRGPPTHDFADIQMKQKVADSVLQRYGGDQPQNGPKLVHKQFNSPIGLYSDNLIESTIKSTVSPSQSVASANSSSVPSPNGTLSRQHSQQNRPTKIQGIFIDMSFLEQKKRILEHQQAAKRQNQQNKQYFFNRPQSAAPSYVHQPIAPNYVQYHPQQAPPSYPPVFNPNSRFSYN